MATSSARTRKVIVVDNSHVARRVGERIRQARTRMALTQRQLAEGRYTAAYISALERGLAKPSMAALTFLSGRLGVSVPDLVAEERPAAGRLEADLLLAAGKAQEALDRYDALLDAAGDDRRVRAELLRGRAEALYRLGRGHEAIGPAAESAQLFDVLASPADAAMARYWLAGAHYQEDNPAEARGILQELLAHDRAGLAVAPDFRFRLLAALGNTEAWDGETSARWRTWRRRARCRARSRSASARHSCRAWPSSTCAWATSNGRFASATRAWRSTRPPISSARKRPSRSTWRSPSSGSATSSAPANTSSERSEIAVRYEDRRLESDVAEAEAQLALERGDEATARERAAAALGGVGQGGSYLAAVGAHLTLARIGRRRGERAAAESEYESASALLGEHRAHTRGRDVLAEWADFRTEVGDLAGANELYAAALGRGRGVRTRH